MNTTSEILDRVPPHDTDAELSVLGSLLLTSNVWDDVSAIVAATDFHDEANATVFARFGSMVKQGLPTSDLALLVEELRGTGDFETIGGVAHLGRIQAAVANAAHAVYYARIVKQHSQRRQTIASATEALRLSYACEEKPGDILFKLGTEAESITSSGCEWKPATAADVTEDVIRKAESIRDGHTRPGVMTGLPDFDREIGGLFGGELSILAARPSVGKTTMALQMAIHMADRGRPVMFASVEMAATELLSRAICGQAGVNHVKVRSGGMNDAEMAAFKESAREMGQLPLHIMDDDDVTVPAIHAAAKGLMRDGLSAVFVDYIGFITPQNLRASRNEQVGEIVKGFKRMARDLDIPVIVLSQLNRDTEKHKGDPRPRLSSLRESGNIEQDADVVMFLHRPEMYNRDDPDLKGEAQMIVAKNRNGPVGEFDLLFHPEQSLFETPAVRPMDTFTWNPDGGE